MDEGRGKERMWRFLSGFMDKVTFQLFCGGRKGIFFSFRMDTLREGTPGRGKRIDKGKGNLNTYWVEGTTNTCLVKRKRKW